MKELSIEEKAQRYDKTIEKAMRWYDANTNKAYRGIFEDIFSELKESDDERIRKRIIHALHGDVLEMSEIKEAVAWLEKQCESYTKRDVDDAYLKGVTNTKNEIEKQYEANYQIRKDIATFIFNYKGDIKDRAKWMDYLGIKVSFVEKQSEQKPADKVKPKFHEGEWVVVSTSDREKVVQIDSIEYFESGEPRYITSEGRWFGNETKAHLWTIQDAKDGDVLYLQKDEKEHIIIYKGVIKERFMTFVSAYCAYNGIVDAFCFADVSRYVDIAYGGIMPATKEQRDLLFKKMHEAGYEWDADKKLLKKIDNEMKIPFGAKDSELQKATYYIPKGFHAEIDDDKVVIKKGGKPTAWSEEDEKILILIIARLHSHQNVEAEEYDKEYNWLISLKDRYSSYEKFVEQLNKELNNGINITKS